MAKVASMGGSSKGKYGDKGVTSVGASVAADRKKKKKMRLKMKKG